MKSEIGSTFASVDAVLASFFAECRRETNDIPGFLTKWKRCHRAQQLELRRKKVNDSVVECDSTIMDSSRPSRSARLTARMNIKKLIDEEDMFLKPKAMPRGRPPKKRPTKQPVEEIKTEEPTASDPKNRKTLRVVLEKQPTAKTRTKTIKKSTKDTDEPMDTKTSEPEVVPLHVKTPEPEVVPQQEETHEVEVNHDEIDNNETPAMEVVAEEKIENVQPVEEETPVQPEPVAEVSAVVVDDSLPISPVPFPDGVERINESLDQSENNPNLVNVFVDEPKPLKKKNGIVADLIFQDGADNLNRSISGEKSMKGGRLKRTKYRRSKLDTTYDVFSPKGSSSILVEKTVTPKMNGTFVVGGTASPVDLFAEGAQTVVRNKNNKKLTVSFVEEDGPGDVEVVEFQAPLPVVSKKRKTEQEVVYDALGNVIDREAAKRTKVITAPSFEVLPNAADGRPVRTRTKVRRLGVDGDGDALENVNLGDEPRVTRTKTKKKTAENLAAKEAVNIARKSKAKRASAIMNKGNSVSKLPSSTQKYKTPLSTVTNQFLGKRPIILAGSNTKEYPSSQKKPRIFESRVICQPSEKEMLEEREAKFKNKMDKEDIAALKKLQAMNQIQEKLKQKNKEKLARAKECRAKQEVEKHENIVQNEKEKERKRKLLLQEREEKLKAEQNKRKMLHEKKLAEIEERRRVEEEARLAKIRELEMEQKRQEQERQRQLELEEKRARERQEEKRKMMEAEKLMKLKIEKQMKAQMELKWQKKQYEGLYLPRSENDFGLEDELSENSEDEEPEPSKRPVPKWVQGAKKGNPLMRYLTNKQVGLFIPMRSRTPNVQQLFNVSPRRVRPRKSSAVWNTTISSPF